MGDTKDILKIFEELPILEQELVLEKLYFFLNFKNISLNI